MSAAAVVSRSAGFRARAGSENRFQAYDEIIKPKAQTSEICLLCLSVSN